MTQEKIIEKLSKIKNHMESAQQIGNEQEAQAFAAMLQNLLLKHKLEMTDIEYASSMQEEPIEERRPDWVYKDGKKFYKDFPDVEIVNRRREWAEQLAHIVADAYACHILVVSGRSYIIFVGHKSNTQIAEYLFITMLRVAEKLSANAAKSYRAKMRNENGGAGDTPKGYRESWLSGFCTRIAQRMREERDAFGKVEGQSTALVRVNKEAIAVKSHMEKYTKKAAIIGGKNHFNHDGYGDGKTAANNINLKSNAVKAGQPNKQLA